MGLRGSLTDVSRWRLSCGRAEAETPVGVRRRGLASRAARSRREGDGLAEGDRRGVGSKRGRQRAGAARGQLFEIRRRMMERGRPNGSHPGGSVRREAASEKGAKVGGSEGEGADGLALAPEQQPPFA
jgi:hypothetical protein